MAVDDLPLLELKGVSVTYGSPRDHARPMLENVNFSLYPGELVAVLGGSGTGKSTLLNVITGFLRKPTPVTGFLSRVSNWLMHGRGDADVEGSIFIAGKEVTFLEPQDRDVGLVMQRFSLYNMSVRKNLEFPLWMRGVPEELWKDEMNRVIVEANIPADKIDKPADSLSGGQQQRVAIGKMLLRDPHLGLFDEAFSNLDPLLRDKLMNGVVKSFSRKSKHGMRCGVVFVTHNREDAEDADRIIYLQPNESSTGGQTLFHVFPSKPASNGAWEEFKEAFPHMKRVVERPKPRLVAANGGKITSSPGPFQHRKYSINEMLEDKQLASTLRLALGRTCQEVGFSDQAIENFLFLIWQLPRDSSTAAYEVELQRFVRTSLQESHLRRALDRRAALIAMQIRPFLVGSTVADIGCGDGMVSWNLENAARRPVLLDVCRYLDSRAASLPFVFFQEGEPIPMDAPVDTSLLLTVLHHSLDPMRLLRETRKVTISRAVVIESVYGVRRERSGSSSIVGSLDTDRQFMYASFIDWIYNRVFHDGVPVPCNYATPLEWPEIFESTGWRVQQAIDLGLDQPSVPEHHYLYVLDVM